MTEILKTLSLFAEQWLGTVPSKLFLLFLGILICILVTAAVWDRKIKATATSLFAGFGMLLVVIALWDIAGALGMFESGIPVRIAAVLAGSITLAMTGFAFFKTELPARYGLLWPTVSLLMFVLSLLPEPLRILADIFGVTPVSVVAVSDFFVVLLLVLHAHTGVSHQRDGRKDLLQHTRSVEQESSAPSRTDSHDGERERESQADQPRGNIFRSVKVARLPWQTDHGTSVTAPIIIFLAVCGVLTTGLLAPQPMIGDEVTHYFMMRTQVEKLPEPNFHAEIPTGWGYKEVRVYPHPFFWHYLGSLVYLLTDGSFFFTQLYQAVFLAQLLLVAYLLARSRGGVESRSALVYLLLLVSLPMTIIFSVAFYQDVPMTAQVLTAFYFLRKRRWFIASVFLCLALGMKVSAIVFFPIFFLYLTIWTLKESTWKRTITVVGCSMVLVGIFTFSLGNVIQHHAQSPFYPVKQANKLIKQVSKKLHLDENLPFSKLVDSVKSRKQKAGKAGKADKKPVMQIIANHPGDLRITANFLIYGGIILYLALIGAALVTLFQIFGKERGTHTNESSLWLWGVGIMYILLAVVFLREAPDARFFYPGLVFCLLPIAEKLVRLPKARLVVIVITTLAFMQSGYALAKTYKLRNVTPEIQEAIAYLERHPPNPHIIFMYPEGNYRLFPVPHHWYMRNQLRDFWRSDNDTRIEILQKYGVGAIVVKKHLIAPVGRKTNNLGVYPEYFVREINKDKRFNKVFDNKGVAIYEIPGKKMTHSD